VKRTIRKIIKSEQGQALPIVIVLLLVSTLILVPLLAYMGSGLMNGYNLRVRADELYAADAGAENALWQLQARSDELPGAVGESWSYPLAEQVNGKDVDVIIARTDTNIYKITSTGTSNGGANTTIETYIEFLDLTFMLDNAITSQNNIQLQPGSEVIGDVLYGGSLGGSGTVTGSQTNDDPPAWPTFEQLHWFYDQDVTPHEDYVFSSDTINVRYTDVIPAMYREGNLTIETTQAGASASLEGTVYLVGDLEFRQTGKVYTINLNNQTIFVDGNINFPSNKCTLIGSGCIIATGDINFNPSMTSDPDSFVFVMSLNGTVSFNPNGDFYGSIAGDVEVNLQPGSTLTWSIPPYEDLNFPTEDYVGKTLLKIIIWDIDVNL